MAGINGFETDRLANLTRNSVLLDTLTQQAKTIHVESKTAEPPKKKRKTDTVKLNVPASRSSARIASTPSRPTYDKEALSKIPTGTRARKPPTQARKADKSAKTEVGEDSKTLAMSPADMEELQRSWAAWQPAAPAPTRDEAGVFHFESHPDFTPNRSPEEVLREGCFGGSYYRPLYSKKLGVTISDDYRELPVAWTEGLNSDMYLTSPTYDPDVNKFKVACGQSIEEWESAGWINHTYDVRGWFQWYCRFYMGRRCEDDERQVSRWKKCVGATGRWRRMLLKKYVAAGVRDVFDDGEDDEQVEVSPVMHQTCHHWAFCVTQEVLDEYWKTRK
ncbi:uncharacterized protein L3040_002657 [Drepanopeziza brunnea f. sp. 'multigermtubi']|uniref:Zn2+-binding protein Melusin/RAR1, contains CHORD domain (ISS) n=1 Tax=Marssonina brunnea f. sp. multigermtubi (strain MB_m1) TaxID=1072389 RepID=K1X359_MARBU|nr:Zn2+-binding protein Melusin/RAR1, contains CHORD domain (ISS) [Drepanopeziza brunnea f. sp. 'multigermtubi' MB_m1]EKD19467.1 Zn2+-binding protein Melusin/RAR1, contains CHORD domain (ISS) [Drepanopeziza brunnea f. sp. 'multigermtubi' MB_m1]KAJ5050787.1 hypothetical protein L3040_002657 [Drepanopeziza brunnea f. sp. 'multigermtubi']